MRAKPRATHDDRQQRGRVPYVQLPPKPPRAQIDKLDLQILKLVNDRAELRGGDRQAQERSGRRNLLARREEEVLKNVLEVKPRGPLDDATVRAIFREIMSGSRAIAEGAQGRLSRPRIQLQPSGRRRALRPGGRVHAASAASPPSSRRSTAATSISASCRWRTPPTAASPTRWTCSCGCRTWSSAARSGCASTTT